MEGDRIAKSLGIYAEKYSKSRARSVDFAGEDDVSHVHLLSKIISLSMSWLPIVAFKSMTNI